ncbi:flagellin [Thermaerobacter sp. FW80]|uniref:flagellin N-terminal helical domain-containing protein n=1 Tax=Thermaerobacter sp. FW80 TaxID=2546351 RepID=UPI0010750A47|nr:flagellin [Thermaerobacter sp. FW80]QBS37217.1 flagellin [Thermaerobacter sp. FW80]
MRINHNVAALNAWRNLSQTNSLLNKSLERLSSGLRINRAADDAAGLAISEKMRAQIAGLQTAQRNAQDAISLIQTAEGALNEVHSILQRMRELAVQAANDSMTDADRANLQKEVEQLIAELDRIGNTTEFNTKKLLDGSAGVSTAVTSGKALNVSATGDTQAGSYTIDIKNSATRGEVWLAEAGAGTWSTFSDVNDTLANDLDITVNGRRYFFAAGTKVQDVIDTVNEDSALTGVEADFNANAIRFRTTDVGSAHQVSVTINETSDVFNLSTNGTDPGNDTNLATDTGTDAELGSAGVNGSPVNYEAVGNRITILSGPAKGLSFTVDASGTYADGSDLDDPTITVGTNGALTFQIGANTGQSLSVAIDDMRSQALGVKTVDVSTRSGASNAISAIDNAINTVSVQRARLGAVQNRLEHTIANLGVAVENLQAAESRIRDVDMALEMANFTRNQILLQSGTAMLAQANAMPQAVLQLLGS